MTCGSVSTFIDLRLPKIYATGTISYGYNYVNIDTRKIKGNN